MRSRLGLVRRDGYWLWVGGPVAPGAAATTIGSVIIVRRGHEASERLLRHELEHVHQFARYGLAGFFARYVPAYLRGRWRGYGHWAAYRRIPFEAAAEFRARRALGLGVVDPEAFTVTPPE